MAATIDTARPSATGGERAVNRDDEASSAALRGDEHLPSPTDGGQSLGSDDDPQSRPAEGWARADLHRFRNELTLILDIAIWRFGFEAELEEALDDALLHESLRETPVLAESRQSDRGLIYAV
ncbi:MAG: hypothetical protein IT305_23505 [Chloroflexi bacterium]|nr:hypothetical protein [Chloroflexota bacterium]